MVRTRRISATVRPPRNKGSVNYPDAFIANLEDGPRDGGAWIKVSAEATGAFSVTNGRTGATTSFK
jgi:hypothetical protein